MNNDNVVHAKTQVQNQKSVTFSEQALVSALLAKPKLFFHVCAIINSKHLSNDSHKTIFNTISDFLAQNKTVDVITVADAIKNEVDNEYLSELYRNNATASKENVIAYAQEIRKQSIEAEFKSIATEIASSNSLNEALLTKAKAKLNELDESGQATKYTIQNYRDGFKDATQAVDWLVNDYIPLKSCGLLAGMSRSYKTFISINLAISVATGTTFLDKETTKSKVLYVLGEGSADFNLRVRAHLNEKNISTDNPDFIENFMFLEAPALIKDAGIDQTVLAQIKTIKPKLIVFDTYSKIVCRPLAENNDVIQNTISQLNSDFKDLNLAYYFVHHVAKASADVDIKAITSRGGQAFEDDVDFMFVAKRDPSNEFKTQLLLKKVKFEQDGILYNLSLKRHILATSDEKEISSLAISDIQKAYDGENKAGRPIKGHLSADHKNVLDCIKLAIQAKTEEENYTNIIIGDDERTKYSYCHSEDVKKLIIEKDLIQDPSNINRFFSDKTNSLVSKNRISKKAVGKNKKEGSLIWIVKQKEFVD